MNVIQKVRIIEFFIMPNDQQSLITNSEASAQIQQTTGPLASFALLQLGQLIWFIITISHSSNFFFLLIQIIISAVNFIACQRYFGRQLVGLSWKFDLNKPTEFFWSHEIEPDPFVPTKMNSNAFWIGIAGSSLFWLFATMFSFISGGWPAFLVYIIVLALSSTNLIVFFKIERIAAKLSADAVRTVLLGKSEFPDAEEFSSSDGNEDAKKNDATSHSPSAAQKTSTINNATDTNSTETKKDQEDPEENNDE